MPRTDLLMPLNDLAYISECTAQDYTGELKSELDQLCRLIREKAPGYRSPEIQEALPQLEQALAWFRGKGGPANGTSLVANISRKLWFATLD